MRGIEWTEATWNPTTGCNKVSPGCKICYAEILSNRLHAMGQAKYANKFQLTMHPDELTRPLGWKKQRMIFVNSMSDLFHKDVTDDFLKKIMETIIQTSQHTYQILTKRSERLPIFENEITKYPENVWLGVTIENNDYGYRADDLRKTNARIKFLSLEPLLGPLPDLDLTGINWVIVGGESGPGARPMEKSWVNDILSKCQKAKIPFFFKQWGGVQKKKAGRELNGKTYDEYPA